MSAHSSSQLIMTEKQNKTCGKRQREICKNGEITTRINAILNNGHGDNKDEEQ